MKCSDWLPDPPVVCDQVTEALDGSILVHVSDPTQTQYDYLENNNWPDIISGDEVYDMDLCKTNLDTCSPSHSRIKWMILP